jgi:cyclic pyranopterin phosphate synthase
MPDKQKQKTKPQLTHFDDQGAARMVNVSAKEKTSREAVAEGLVFMLPGTLSLILNRSVSKGDVFGVARVAGIMAAKKTADIIPLCHPLNLTSIEISFDPVKKRSCVRIQATVKTLGQTGVEMEALTAVAAACLTIYDMCKAVDRGMTISDVRLMKKTGGKSGTFIGTGAG